MINTEILNELNAMRTYLAGDCNCCEHSGACDFYANLSFPEKTTDCRWEFSRALIREAKRVTE